jgi:hypothetical protein
MKEVIIEQKELSDIKIILPVDPPYLQWNGDFTIIHDGNDEKKRTHIVIEKQSLPTLIAALSELTGGQTWEDWMRRAEYAAAEYTKPIPIRGAKMQACTYKYMLDWIRDNVPLLPNTVGDGWIKVEDRLPDNMQEVLFYLASDTVKFGRFYESDQWERKNMFVCNQGAFFTTGSVVAWKLVAKPKELSNASVPPAPNQNKL